MDRQADILARFPNVPIELVGYADTVEATTARERQSLGKRRAEAVRTALVQRGIKPERMTVRGADQQFLIPRDHDEEILARMRAVFTHTTD